jgi:hypothetical protein
MGNMPIRSGAMDKTLSGFKLSQSLLVTINQEPVLVLKLFSGVQ